MKSALAPPLLDKLLAGSIILPEDWHAIPESIRVELHHTTDRHVLLPRLVELRLLTEYQAVRIAAGKSFGLILGNYRVLDRLGVGGMGVVYRAEHRRLRRVVAIKVLAAACGGLRGGSHAL